jgi:hypothetical protein
VHAENEIMGKARQIQIRLTHAIQTGEMDIQYQEGKFFLLVPTHRTAYSGEISEFDDLLQKTEPVSLEEIQSNLKKRSIPPPALLGYKNLNWFTWIFFFFRIAGRICPGNK